MLNDDLLHHGYAQPGSVRLSRIEGHEYLGQSVGGDPRSIVGDGDPLALHRARWIELTSDDHASATRIVRGGLGRISREVQDGLTEKGFVAGYVAELPLAGHGNSWHRLGNFGPNAIDQRAKGHPFVGEIERARKLQELSHNVSQGARLVQDLFAVFAQFRSGFRLAADHLR